MSNFAPIKDINKKNKIMQILLFNNKVYEINELRELAPRQLFELYLEGGENVACYDTLKSYEIDHNDGCLKWYDGWYLFFVNG